MRIAHFWHGNAKLSDNLDFYSIEFVTKQCPWAVDIVEIYDGIIAFESPIDAYPYNSK